MKNIEVRNKIKEYCKGRKITLKELSQMSGVSDETLYHKKSFTVKTVCMLIAALDCKFEDLFEIIEVE